ncbi:MAG: HEAT repeat domain-containing protein [Planctomycetes bacterium]|nr:HEAT repeat domain-containing protein [Planctomycetota bacterium]
MKKSTAALVSTAGFLGLVLVLSLGAARAPRSEALSSSLSELPRADQLGRPELALGTQRRASLDVAQEPNTYRFRFELEQSGAIEGGEESAPMSFGATIAGVFTETVLERTPDGLDLALGLEDVKVRGTAPGVPERIDGAALRVLLGREGLVSGYDLPLGAPSPAARLQRLLCLRLHLLPTATPRWTGALEDETGRCTFEIEREELAPDGSSRWLRKKSRVELEARGPIVGDVAVAHSEDRLALADGWPLTATCEERLDTTIGGFVLRSTLRLRIDSREVLPQPTEARPAPQWRPWPRERAQDEEDAPPPSFEECLEALRAIDAAQDYGSLAMQRAFDALVRRLASDPKAARELVEQMRGGAWLPPRVSEDLCSVLCSALADAGAAGGAHCVAAMSELLASIAEPSCLGSLARSLHQLRDLPWAELQPLLAPALAKLDGSRSDYGDELVLGLGSLLRQAEAADRAGAEALLARLNEHADRADAWGAVLVTVAENASEAAILAAALPRREARDADLRARAMEALGATRDPRATEALREAALADADEWVRATAARALARQNLAAADEALEHVLLRETDPSVRRAALEELAAQRHGDPRWESLARRLAAEDPDEAVRGAAGALLAEGLSAR